MALSNTARIFKSYLMQPSSVQPGLVWTTLFLRCKICVCRESSCSDSLTRWVGNGGAPGGTGKRRAWTGVRPRADRLGGPGAQAGRAGKRPASARFAPTEVTLPRAMLAAPVLTSPPGLSAPLHFTLSPTDCLGRLISRLPLAPRPGLIFTFAFCLKTFPLIHPLANSACATLC